MRTTPHRRIRSRRAARLLVLLGAAAVLLAPTPAGAAPDRSDPPDVVPLLDCVIPGDDGSWTAVLGYDNRTGDTAAIPVGPANQLTPTRYGEPQPTTFGPGVHHAVLPVRVTGGGGFVWHLGRDNLAVRSGDAACTAEHLPASGNGTGPLLAFTGALVVGLAVTWRPHRRRARA
jgi:hypothetical protein